MELRHLRYFAAVAETLNFTRAARQLRVAQPALSRQIRQLEDELGVRLLERSQRGVALTAAGAAFLVETGAILRQSEQAVKRAQSAGKPGRGLLNIGYIWGLFHTLAPAALAAFRVGNPEVAAHLFDLTATEQATALVEGRLDAGFIGFAPEADLAKLEKLRVGTCDFMAVLPENHPMARRARVHLGSLAEEFFIAISRDNYPSASEFVLTACRRAGFNPRILQAAERGHTILGLVAGHCGVALLPEPLRGLPHRGVVFRPLAEPVRGELFLAWNAGRSNLLRDDFVRTLQ